MIGRYYSREQLRKVAATLDIPATGEAILMFRRRNKDASFEEIRQLVLDARREALRNALEQLDRGERAA